MSTVPDQCDNGTLAAALGLFTPGQRPVLYSYYEHTSGDLS